MPLKALIKYSLLWCILLLPVAIAAQDYNYRHYTERDGLVGPTVYTMCQDREGFMWFGTETGVSRFDGTSFKNFTIKDGLPNNEVIRIYCDSKGRVWLMPFKYEMAYYKNGVIHNRYNDPLVRKLQIDELVTEMADTKDGLLLMDRGNLFRVEDTGMVSLTSDDREHARGMVKLRVTNTGKLRMVSFWRIIDYSQGKFTIVDTLPRLILSGGQMIIDDDLTVYVPAAGIVHIKSERFGLNYDIKVHPVNTIERLSDSLICVSTSRGCQVINILQRRVVATYLPNKNVNNIFHDREGSIWIATFNDGVYRISSTRFRNLLGAGHDGQKISVYSILKQGKRLHVGTDMGYFTADEQEDGQFVVKRDKNIHTPVRHITGSKDLLVLCNGISAMVKKGGSAFRRVFSNNAIKRAAIGPNDWLYLAGSNGMRRVSVGSNWGLLDNLSSSRGTNLALIGHDIYYGSPNGLHVIPNYGSGGIDTDQPVPSNDTLLKAGIRDMTTGSDGMLWMATDAGVVGVKNNKVLRHITTKDGLFSNSVRCIYLDRNVLWAGSDKGISRIAIGAGTSHVTHYGSADGLASDIVNCITVDGNTVYVATQDGISYFDKHLGNSYSRCDLQLMGVSINGSLVKPDSMPALHYRNSNLHLDYVAISYKSDGDMSYYYRLKGLDSTWKYTRQTSLDLISLPPGSYTLELYATNHFGVNSKVITLPLAVTGPFWQEIWFLALVALALIALTWAVIQWRLRVIRKKESAERAITHQLHDLEQKALRAQMNPHFIFNCLTSVQEFIIDQDMEAANRYLTRFARLIRQTLDISMLPAITVQDEVRYLTTYLELEQMRFSSGFTFSVTADPAIKTADTLWPGMVLQPIVENAVYHGFRNLKDREGVLSINFRVEGQMIICEVKDNGVGRKMAEMQKAKGHISWGSRITQQRIDIMNKGISSSIGIAVEDLPDDVGTVVTVRFPLTVSMPA